MLKGCYCDKNKSQIQSVWTSGEGCLYSTYLSSYRKAGELNQRCIWVTILHIPNIYSLLLNKEKNQTKVHIYNKL